MEPAEQSHRDDSGVSTSTSMSSLQSTSSDSDSQRMGRRTSMSDRLSMTIHRVFGAQSPGKPGGSAAENSSFHSAFDIADANDAPSDAPAGGGAAQRHAVLSHQATSGYRKEGNHEHYTAQALDARRQLRWEPRVVAWLEAYYKTFASARDPRDGTPGARSAIDREEVLAVQVKMCRALFAPDEWDFAEAAEAAEADWEREVRASERAASRHARRRLALADCARASARQARESAPARAALRMRRSSAPAPPRPTSLRRRDSRVSLTILSLWPASNRLLPGGQGRDDDAEGAVLRLTLRDRGHLDGRHRSR